jgi:hypothetical protein
MFERRIASWSTVILMARLYSCLEFSPGLLLENGTAGQMLRCKKGYKTACSSSLMRIFVPRWKSAWLIVGLPRWKSTLHPLEAPVPFA